MEPRQYRNFTLRMSAVARKKGRYHVQIFGLIPYGRSEVNEPETVTFDPKSFVYRGLNLLDAVHSGQMTQKQLYFLGTALADLLFPGSIRNHWWDCLKLIKERKQGLRLRLLLEAPDLISIPWEFIYMRPPWEETDCELNFLALQPEVSIVRHETLDIAEPSLTPQASYRLVAAMASPSDQPTLALSEERSAIESALASLPRRDLLQTTWVEKSTRRSLREALRTPADILHFSGHCRLTGNSGQIYLEGKDGTSDPYPATALASLVQTSPLRLAVLNACETGARSGINPWSGVASALVRTGVAAVVASQFSILDANAIPLAEEIYLGILQGLTIDEVVTNARRALYQETELQILDWGAPVLYLRAEQGLIFPPVITLSGSQLLEKQEKSQQININVTQTITGPVSGTVNGIEAGSIGLQVAPTLTRAVPITIPDKLPPRQDMPLIGRENDLSQAFAKLESDGKVYFYGTYGVGKTSLASVLFKRMKEKKIFSDGCIWEEVSHLSAEKVLDRVAGYFNGQQVAATTDRNDKIRALNNLLVERSNLLIALDEVDDRSVAKAVFQAAGNCTVILNGTQRLNLAGAAAERRLQPLGRTDAIELFKILARPAGAPFSDEESKLVAGICKKMRYLPLAIKLAALKYAEGIESLQELTNRLAVEPESLSPEDGVAAIFAAHYDALLRMPSALNLLVRVAGFPAFEAPLNALQKGLTDFYSSKDKLIDLGLVDYDGSDRLVLHPLLGNQVRIVEPDTVAAEQERAGIWLTGYASFNHNDYNALEREQSNLFALMDRFTFECKWDNLISLMVFLFDYLRVRGQWQEASDRLDKVVAAKDQITQPWNLAWAYLHLGILRLLRSEYTEAERDFDHANQLFIEKNDRVYQGIVLLQSSKLYGIKGDYDSAKKNLEKALELMGREGPPKERISALNQLAGIFTVRGEMANAQTNYNLALELSQSTGEKEEESRIHLALGTLERKSGNLQEALKHLDLAYQLSVQLGDLLHLASIQQESGYFYYYQGQFEKAESAFNEAFSIFHKLKYPRGLAQVLHAMGNLALACKNPDKAVEQYTEALQINQTLGHKAAAAYNQYQLGVVEARKGLIEQAEISYSQTLAFVQDEKVKDVVLEAAVWFQLSNLALRQNDVNHARKFVARAKELAEKGKHRFTEGAALYQMGLMQAQEGQMETAQETLALAHAAFEALKAPEEAEVLKLQKLLGDKKKSPGEKVIVNQAGGIGNLDINLDEAFKADKVDIILDDLPDKIIAFKNIDLGENDINRIDIILGDHEIDMAESEEE